MCSRNFFGGFGPSGVYSGGMLSVAYILPVGPLIVFATLAGLYAMHVRQIVACRDGKSRAKEKTRVREYVFERESV